MRAIVCLLGCAALAGCRTRLIEPPAEPGGSVDLTMPALDLAACRQQHHLVARAMSELRQLSPAPGDEGQQQSGSVIRILVGVPLAPCEAFGRLDVRVMPGDATDFVVITARVWQSDVDCGAPKTAWRVAMLSSDQGRSNPRLVVSDGAPSATRNISFAVALRPPGANCGTAVPINGRCQLDCQCDKTDRSARCILDRPGPSASRTCQVPCAEDADCPALAGLPSRGFQRCSVGDEFLCVAPTSDQCTLGCPFGQLCQRGSCRPVAWPIPMGIPSCHCDAECGTGWICTATGGCILPCATLSDCAPSLNTCDDANGCAII